MTVSRIQNSDLGRIIIMNIVDSTDNYFRTDGVIYLDVDGLIEEIFTFHTFHKRSVSACGNEILFHQH